jgi:muconate cycloisomerase
MAMKVVQVQSTIAALKRRRSLKTVYGDSPRTVTVVVRLETDEGITGWGQTVAPAPWYGESAEAIKVNIDRYLAPVVLGGDPLDISGLFASMYLALREGRYAITAVEYALWDIKGKALGVPVYQLLGGRLSPGAPLHGFVERESAPQMAARIAELSGQGWNWFKTKIGFGVEEDLAWYRELRSLVPDGVRFQLDGNTGFGVGEAVQLLRQLERLGGLALVEQPVASLGDMAHLANQLETPLQADEAVTSPRSVYEIAERRAAHVLHFKMHKYGGILEAQRMAAIAEAAGLEISVAPYFDVLAAAAAHLAASVGVAKWPAGFSDMEDTLLAEPYEPDGLVLEPLERPGLGVEVDGEKLRQYGEEWE